MDVARDNLAEEVKRLQRCINDLVSILALPAIWTGSEPYQIVRTLIDALLGMLRLDLVYVRLEKSIIETPLEMVRVAPSRSTAVAPREVREMLKRALGDDPRNWPPVIRSSAADGDMAIVPLRLGLYGELGLIIVGSRRADFPAETERLLLSVAANQAVIGLQAAWLLSEQRRVASELDQRVARRTIELAAANEELQKEVAERRLAEQKLREEENELRRSEAFLAEGQRLSLTGTFSWRVATDEIIWSEQLYRIFEFDPDVPVTLELVGTRVHPDDIPLLNEMIERVRNVASDFDYQHRLLMPDRSVKYLHLLGHATRNQNGQLEYIGAAQDVTQRFRSEEELGRVRSELAHAVRATSLGVMTASIAHEVSQPLAGIVTNAGTCLRMLGADPPNIHGARETARRTIRDANRAADVVTRLRALFARKEAVAEAVDLNEATREVIALSVSDLQRDRVILRSELADSLPPVTGDRVQLQQVILNLLRNAADAMRDVTDRPRHLVIRTAHDDDQVRLSVQDAGVGLEPQGLSRLFEAFYSTKSDGMGIGLSVSRSIIEHHRGRLWAAANEGPGATFSFSLPRRPDSTADAAILSIVPTLATVQPSMRDP